MHDDVRAILQVLLDEIEDLRAGQVMTSVALSVLPDFSTTNFEDMKKIALEKNRPAYDGMRKAIDELASLEPPPSDK